jgi:hypothetical protein
MNEKVLNPPTTARPTATGTLPATSPPPPAYYAKGTTGWRAWWTLLHPPYTLMHLSFVVVGAALAPTIHMDRLAWTLLAFLFAMGIAAHALDEHQGRPLRTRIPTRLLLGAAGISLLVAAMVGLWGMLHYGLPWGFAFIAVGVFLVVAYNLELFSGRFHNGLTFALAWGAFPVLVGYYAQTGRMDTIVLLGAGYATVASGAQRALSTPARRLRRKTHRVSGHLINTDGTRQPITRETLLENGETGLRYLVLLSLLVAALLLAPHLL